MLDSRILNFPKLGALRASLIHAVCSVSMALFMAALVFGFWYPFPYSEFSGGKDLFLLIMAVDVVCGPLLTLVIYNKLKPQAELRRDIALVVIIQLLALAYGFGTVWEARPLYLVHEIDRFKVIALPDIDHDALVKLPLELRPHFFSGPRVVSIRDPLDEQERDKVLFAALQGGRDYAERPEFYLPYAKQAVRQSLTKAKSLSSFLDRYPDQTKMVDVMKKSAVSDPIGLTQSN